MSENKARVAALVRQARDEMRAGNRDEALNLLKKAIAMDPGSSAVTEVVIEIEKEMAAAAAAARAEKQDAQGKAPQAKPQQAPPQQAPQQKPKTAEAAKPAQAPQAKPQQAPPQQAPQQKPKTEPTPPSASKDDLLKALFASSDKAMAAGDETGALTALRKARELAPDSQEAVSRLRNLQKRLKARTLVGVSKRKLSEGAFAEALARVREAFDLWPGTEGLSAVLDALEAEASRKPAAEAPAPGQAREKAEVKPEPKPQPAAEKPAQEDRSPRPVQPAPRRVPQRSANLSADDYVRRVREQIQMSAFPAAAEIAAEGLSRFPDNVLLKTFVEKFSRMGLLPK